MIVTKEHLERAKTAIKEGGLASQCCVVAQAAKDNYPDLRVTCGICDILLYKDDFDAVPKQVRFTGMQKLTGLFDHKDYDSLEALLPVELKVESW